VPGLAAWGALWIVWLVAAARMRPAHDPTARAVWSGGVAAVLAFHAAGLTELNYGDTEVVYLVYVLMALPLAVVRRRNGVAS